ncbi:MAG TPA: Hpt domain-containing protein [Rhizomicrobium sp.]|nr:Hpt domain-containing protein [Rhizomicrobium sp.]
MSKQPIEIFMPPNMLKAKVGGTIAGLDMAAIGRAEAALENLKTEFSEWIETDAARLAEYRNAYAVKKNADTRGNLYRAAHDLKGQALTFEYPLVARVASSLCKLLDAPDRNVPLTLIDAHVDAIRVIVRDKMKATGDKMALVLAKELEARVDEFLAR